MRNAVAAPIGSKIPASLLRRILLVSFRGVGVFRLSDWVAAGDMTIFILNVSMPSSGSQTVPKIRSVSASHPSTTSSELLSLARFAFEDGLQT